MFRCCLPSSLLIRLTTGTSAGVSFAVLSDISVVGCVTVERVVDRSPGGRWEIPTNVLRIVPREMSDLVLQWNHAAHGVHLVSGWDPEAVQVTRIVTM